jgi:hypothetical protein
MSFPVCEESVQRFFKPAKQTIPEAKKSPLKRKLSVHATVSEVSIIKPYFSLRPDASSQKND